MKLGFLLLLCLVVGALAGRKAEKRPADFTVDPKDVNVEFFKTESDERDAVLDNFYRFLKTNDLVTNPEAVFDVLKVCSETTCNPIALDQIHLALINDHPEFSEDPTKAMKLFTDRVEELLAEWRNSPFASEDGDFTVHTRRLAKRILLGQKDATIKHCLLHHGKKHVYHAEQLVELKLHGRIARINFADHQHTVEITFAKAEDAKLFCKLVIRCVPIVVRASRVEGVELTRFEEMGFELDGPASDIPDTLHRFLAAVDTDKTLKHQGVFRVSPAHSVAVDYLSKLIHNIDVDWDEVCKTDFHVCCFMIKNFYEHMIPEDLSRQLIAQPDQGAENLALLKENLKPARLALVKSLFKIYKRVVDNQDVTLMTPTNVGVVAVNLLDIPQQGVEAMALMAQIRSVNNAIDKMVEAFVADDTLLD